MADSLVDNFTGSGVPAGREPDGGGWVPGAKWKSSGPGIVEGGVLSNPPGDNVITTLSYPVDTDYAESPVLPGSSAKVKMTCRFRLIEGTSSVFMKVFNLYQEMFAYVNAGWFGVSADARADFGETRGGSDPTPVTLGAWHELSMDLSASGSVIITLDGNAVVSFSVGGAFFSQSGIKFVRMDLQSGQCELDYVTVNDEVVPPEEASEFWTGFLNTFEVV